MHAHGFTAGEKIVENHRAPWAAGLRGRGGRHVMYGDIYCTEYIAL